MTNGRLKYIKQKKQKRENQISKKQNVRCW